MSKRITSILRKFFTRDFTAKKAIHGEDKIEGKILLKKTKFRSFVIGMLNFRSIQLIMKVLRILLSFFIIHGENFMAIFTALSVVIWFSLHMHAKPSFAHRLQTAKMPSSRTSAQNNGPRAQKMALGCKVIALG